MKQTSNLAEELFKFGVEMNKHLSDTINLTKPNNIYENRQSTRTLEALVEQYTKQLIFTIDPFGDSTEEEREDMRRTIENAMCKAYAIGCADAYCGGSK
jgi:hypothetical protein